MVRTHANSSFATENAVGAPELVDAGTGIVRVRVPFIVDHEFVLVVAGRQFEPGFSHPFPLFLEWVGFGVPVIDGSGRSWMPLQALLLKL